MKLLFWNMGGNDNVSLALSHMQDNDVGVAAFAEHFGAKFSDGILRDSGYRVLGYGGCDKIVVLASESIEVLDCFEESRFTVLAMESSEARFVVAAAHLIDRMSAPDSALRLRTIRKMMGVVHGSESALSINNTIAMGDFNANPYDKELLLPEAFNAMLFKGLLRSKSSRVWDGVDYPYFYNPTIHWLSEDDGNYGSFYYSSGDGTNPIWNCYDQMLVSPALMDRINGYSYLKRIGDEDLIAKVRPRREISDHLPLFVDIDMR